MNGNTQINQNQQRRNYFRVDQDVILDIKQVKTAIANTQLAIEQFECQTTQSLVTELKKIDYKNQEIMRLISSENRPLAEYLRSLNSKIDIIARHCIKKEGSNTEAVGASHINISEDGMCFSHTRTLYKDSYIAIKLSFLSNYSTISCFAKVLRCEQNEDKAYQIAVQFSNMEEADQQLLSKLILKTQASGLKQSHRNDTH